MLGDSFCCLRGVTVCSAIVSVVCAAFGIICALLMDTPVGPTVVAVNIIVFFVFCILGATLKRSEK